MRSLFVGCILLSAASLMHAGVIWDFGPGTGANGGYWVNQTDNQNFADNVTFGADTQVDGFNLFTGASITDPASTFHFKVLADDNGLPGAYLYQWDQVYSSFSPTTYNGIYEAQFLWPTPLVFVAGTTYWVGVSGNGFEAGQSSVVGGPGDGTMAQFEGSQFTVMATVGDQMFQLTDGTLESSAPEPATLMLIPAALMGLALLRRKR